MKKTLKKFLIKEEDTCKENFKFAKDLTLEEFLNTCQRGDWILWLFARMNPKSLHELTLAKGHCANTVRELMTDARSTKAVDVAIDFGEGKATRKELDDAARAAYDAYVASNYANYANYGAYAAARATYATYGAYVSDDAAAAYAYAAAYVAKKQNQKLTADICRKYLPLEIWNQSKI